MALLTEGGLLTREIYKHALLTEGGLATDRLIPYDKNDKKQSESNLN